MKTQREHKQTFKCLKCISKEVFIMSAATTKTVDQVYNQKTTGAAGKNVAAVKPVAAKPTAIFRDITKERWFWDLAEIS